MIHQGEIFNYGIHMSAETKSDKIKLTANEALLRSDHFVLASVDPSGKMHFQADVSGMRIDDYKKMATTIVSSLMEIIITSGE